jgi:uncharacterized repeat protein (TIGR03803 family)
MVTLIALSLPSAARARDSFSVVYGFQGNPDGDEPTSVFRDAEGNIFGTTVFGGNDIEGGTVYAIDAKGKENILYRFCSLANCADGSAPNGVVEDGKGNLYGSTSTGGSANVGTIFKLSPKGHLSVLWAFQNGADGAYPAGSPIIDSQQKLYGVAGGGETGDGVVFKVSSSGHETVLYAFRGGADGAEPVGGLVADAWGNLYGATTYWGRRKRPIL